MKKPPVKQYDEFNKLLKKAIEFVPETNKKKEIGKKKSIKHKKK